MFKFWSISDSPADSGGDVDLNNIYSGRRYFSFSKVLAFTVKKIGLKPWLRAVFLWLEKWIIMLFEGPKTSASELNMIPAKMVPKTAFFRSQKAKPQSDTP
jgi:hypothetical protein